ncbi:hypothetical protein BJV78DRAFT_955444 [Lactifluus subvellereus]|nr:hypothetical protein BJV78DRAFT_955444 [Lactifluus subvellereus]
MLCFIYTSRFHPISVTTSSGPASRTTNIPSEASQDIAADGATQVIADIPSPAKPILQFTLAHGAALLTQRGNIDNHRLSCYCTWLPIFDSSPSCSQQRPRRGLHLPTESSANESDRIPHGPVSSSSSPIISAVIMLAWSHLKLDLFSSSAVTLSLDIPLENKRHSGLTNTHY